MVLQHFIEKAFYCCVVQVADLMYRAGEIKQKLVILVPRRCYAARNR